MKKAIIGIIIIISCHRLYSQETDCYALFEKYSEYTETGDFVNAKDILLKILEPDTRATGTCIVAAYNNLGVVMLNLGEYDKALEYNIKAERYITDLNSTYLGDIFNNRGDIMNIKKSYDVARDYLEKSIRIYQNSGLQDPKVIKSLNAAYINISISLLETRQYRQAIEYLEKSVDLSSRFKYKDLSLTFLNLAKNYNKLDNHSEAEQFFLKSIAQFKKDFGDGYFRMGEAFFDYGAFLEKAGRYDESLAVYRKALSICLKNYEEKHTLVSLSYKHIGDICSIQERYDSALYYYQKSLIAVVRNYDNQNVFSNPSIDSSIFEIRLLDNLKSKAQALKNLADINEKETEKKNFLSESLKTTDLAIQLIERIRNDYYSEESRMYLAENEKETYVFGVNVAFSLYSLTHEDYIATKMYSIAQKAKSAILRNEITGNELLYSGVIPDSLSKKMNILSSEIGAYSNLLLEESRKKNPDKHKITLLKDDLFNMNREKELVEARIDTAFPRFHDLIRMTEPVPLAEIQAKLKNNEIILDYLLSNNIIDGKRKLMIFCISRNSLDFKEEMLDSQFLRNAEIIRNTSVQSLSPDSFSSYAGALNYMYQKLIFPVEDLLSSSCLIIIPDEEIGWLPFDAFIKSKPDSARYDFERLHYLINDFTISYGYSSSLIFNSKQKIKKTDVFAFSPDYSNSYSVPQLRGAQIEIQSIYKGFGGINFSGSEATKENFMQSLKKPAIFHLAMHSLSDSLNSKYSYLMFDTHKATSEKEKLFNYEISLQRINSPMVVLSACNSGTGTLYYGEGMMSLSRSFILAGASAVVKTAWDVNDEASSGIMTDFYEYLSKGKPKNEAMHLAKLKYLKNSSPAFKAPYFWAAYEVLGDYSPVSTARRKKLIIFLLILTGAAGIAIYLRRRRIFSDRSR